MAETFLTKLAKYLYENTGGDFENHLIILPNRRSAVFLENEFKTLFAGEVFWLPEMTTITELMERLSGLSVAEPAVLSIELYKQYATHISNPEPFDQFYGLSQIILNDFDDIDKAMIDAGRLYRNIKDIKEIDQSFDFLTEEQKKIIAQFWNVFEQGNLSVQKKKFLELWQSLAGLYASFREKLISGNRGYEGLIYRTAIERLSEHSLAGDYEFISVAGFNVLNQCEIKLFNVLKGSGKAHFFWDYDEYYVQNAHHQAGMFMRRNLRNYPPAWNEAWNYFTRDKEIRCFQAAGDMAQINIAGSLLSKINIAETDVNKAAVVFGKEELLIPMLNHIPENIQKMNVTMGYPIGQSSTFAFFEALLKMQRNKVERNKSFAFYHKDVHSVLSHQALSRLDDKNEWRRALKQEAKMYINPDIFLSSPDYEAIFRPVHDTNDLVYYLQEVLQRLFSRFGEKENSLEKEILWRIKRTLNNLGGILELYPDIDLNISIFASFFRQYFQHLSVPFKGEPLSGLQLMGILETRLLDFEHVILISMNEGVFPKGDAAVSIIPYNIRRGYGLPTYEHQDAIYAYYFYRLISRAKKVDLIYNTAESFGLSGEKSRFIYQLDLESPHKLLYSDYALNYEKPPERTIRIEKNGLVKKKILEFKNGDRMLSPTALNDYLDCSLRFYYKYILGIREQEALEDSMDLRDFGNVLHKTMELIYKPFRGKMVNEGEIKLISDKKNIEEKTLQAFASEVFKNSVPLPEIINEIRGRNYFIFEIIKKYAANILSFDRTKIPFRLVETEYAAKAEIFTSEGSSFHIRGIIDRIDEKEGKIVLSDYKTGRTDPVIGSVDDLFEREKPTRKKEVFQVFFYALLYAGNKRTQDKIQPRILNIRELSRQNFNGLIKLNKVELDSIDERELEGFRNRLAEVFSEIENEEVAFEQTGNTDICTYCPFSNVCERY